MHVHVHVHVYVGLYHVLCSLVVKAKVICVANIEDLIYSCDSIAQFIGAVLQQIQRTDLIVHVAKL